jgi:predicted O-methyltransferase YrrM
MKIKRIVINAFYHIKHVWMAVCGMALWRKEGRELATRAYVSMLDLSSPIPAVKMSDVFGDNFTHGRENFVLIHPGEPPAGSINIYETFLISALVKLIQPKVILEIGTYRGRTTFHLFHNASEDTIIYTIDLPEDEFPDNVTDANLTYNKTRDFLPNNRRIKQIKINTRDWEGMLEEKINFAFIDADHSYSGVKNDTEKAFSCLDKYACVCWHDSLWPDSGYGVHRYLTELHRKNSKLFRIMGKYELSSLTIWMSRDCGQKLGLPKWLFESEN